MAWHDPWFTVLDATGGTWNMRARSMARALLFSPHDFSDPETYFFDWTRFKPAEVSGWRAGLAAALRRAGLLIPAPWCDAGDEDMDVDDALDDRVQAFRAAEQVRLGRVLGELRGDARARSTIKGLKNYGLKVLWWLVSRGHEINPPSSQALAMAFAFLVDLRGNSGASQKTSEACALLGRLNDWPAGLLAGAARTPLDAAQRLFRQPVRKVAGLELEHVRRIMERYAFLRGGRHANEQWEFAVGSAISVGFKTWARYNDLSQMRLDDGACNVFDTYIDLRIPHRKNNQFEGDTVTVARPADPADEGIYGVLALAKRVFRSGFILPHIDAKGVVDRSRPMEYAAFVRHLRAALVFIGLTSAQAAEYAAHSLRSGAATEAGPRLTPLQICLAAGVSDINWIIGYTRATIADRIHTSRAVGL